MAGETIRITGGPAQGQQIDVGQELQIGRSAGADGRLGDDPEISRQHARMSRNPAGQLVVEDLGSTNGTYVNGQRIAGPTPLNPGDTVQMGRSTLTVEGAAGGGQATAIGAVPIPPSAPPPAAAAPPPPAYTPPPPPPGPPTQQLPPTGAQPAYAQGPPPPPSPGGPTPYGAAPGGGNNSRIAVIGAAIVAVIAIAVVLVLLLSGGDDNKSSSVASVSVPTAPSVPTTPPSTATTPPPTTDTFSMDTSDISTISTDITSDTTPTDTGGGNSGGIGDYPPNVKDQFVSGCEKGGGSKTQCTCTIDAIEEKYSLIDFLDLLQKTSGGSLPPALQKIVEKCR